LGGAFHERFERIGELDDLDAVITTLCCAVEITPDTDPEKPGLLSNYGASLQTRFERVGEFEDIERAITILRRADELVSNGHPSEVYCSNNLGNSLLSRFRATGELEDLKQAILSHWRALELTPNGHPDKASRNIGNSFLARFKHTGDLKDVEQAISSHRRAVELTPDGHSNKPAHCSHLGTSFITRFGHTGELEDLELAISMHRRAVELTPDGHPSSPSWLSNLGSSLHTRFKHTGDVNDLEQAISLHCQAIQLMPDSHPHKPAGFNNLGNSFLTRFERTGELDDLEQSISFCRRAVELTPDGHPGKPLGFNNLGNSFRTRFQRTGELEDLEQAILSHRRAIELTPDGHPDKPLRYNNLGIPLSMRFQRMEKFEDLEDAILTYRRAIELTADDHPEKPAMLSNLCQNMCSRFQQTQELTDVQEAISAGRLAIELSPLGHPRMSGYRSALARCLHSRFERCGDISDIEEAIPLYMQAVELIPKGDPWLCSLLWHIGGALELLFEDMQDKTNFDAVVETYMLSALHPSGRPSTRFNSAKRCARLLSDHPSFSTTESLLSVHSRIIEILPEIVWLGHNIHRRYEESSQLGELVNAAVAVAIAAGEFERAIEWLEAGRALIWSQVLALRTPLDELQDSQPELAESFRSVQQQLQMSAHNTFAHDVDVFRSVDGFTINPEADRHRGLVIEYDKLMKWIHSYPGFEDFLRPKRLESLLPPPGLMGGPLVYINVHPSRCDAIIISPSGAISATPLLDLSLERAEELQRLWTDHVMGGRALTQRSLGSVGDLEGELNPLKYYLRHTWTWIVQPVLEALDLAALIQDDRLPHIVWCPTGPLMQLPLHAAGIYDEPDGPRVYDFVVSSYTPSLSALARSFQGGSVTHATRNMLIVTQPSTPGHMPLPGTVHEGNRLQNILSTSEIMSNWLNDETATVHEVRAVIKQYSWIHLACHGSQNRADVTQSAFHLFDGSLTLADLMGTAADDAELAFLSACETAVGDEEIPEESAHLAAGMLAVGFKGVIATMWSIQDADAPIVVEAYYKELLALRGSGTLGKGETGAAYALHEATRVLRERVGEDRFMRWVPFVHFGI
ncbi:hypothetical protein PENSPDRAFT_583940, partial [Peniophora sp. CONT]